MILTLWIKEDAKIHLGAQVYIKTMGLIGEKYVGIMDGQEGPFLEPDSLIIGEEPFELEKLLGKSEKIAENLESASTNLDEFSNDVKRNPWKLLFRTEKGN
jgi:ABC-type transporter Mla subunit MlaD